jgi:sigma-B regulation protein RsbU (phosphoserine phosphatase)
MGTTFINLLIDLIKTAGVVIIFAYLVTRTRFFIDILEKRPNYKSRLIMIAFFGALSIFGTYGGVVLPSGAIVNIRDLGPIIAGLVGGPIVGLGAGLIGGLQRYFIGGFVAVSSSSVTVLAGLVGGLIYLLRKGIFPRIWAVMLYAACVELFLMGFTLLISRPFDQTLEVVKQAALPMIIANAAGTGIFAFIIHNLITERKNATEKERLRAELERKKFEIETARNIQRSFLPDSEPHIKGFDIAGFTLPALEVGGDFYDFIPISQDRWGFVIADVSGKGFPAALFMALSRTCVRAYAVGKTTACGAICMANNLISQDDKSDMFVTLFYALLDTDSKQLHYVNAGHNPPLVFGRQGDGLVLLAARGIALGVMPDIALEEKEVPLHEGEIVLLYTDGVTEAVNMKKEQFGQQRLITLVEGNRNLSAQELIRRIEQEVIAFSEGQPQFDDLTLMVLKVLK